MLNRFEDSFATHDVETLQFKGFTIVSIKWTENIPERYQEFRLAEISGPMFWKNGGKKVQKDRWFFWSYKRATPAFAKGSDSRTDRARIAIIDNEPVIGVIRDDLVTMAIPVAKLPAITGCKGWTEVGYWYPGTNTEEVMALKQEVASHFGLEPRWNKTEAFFLGRKIEEEAGARRQEAEALAAHITERKASKAKRHAKKQGLVKDILSRRTISVNTEKGPRHGHPVLSEDEWRVLHSGTFCVLVTNLPGNGLPPEPKVVFQVKEQRGQKVMDGALPVIEESTEELCREEHLDISDFPKMTIDDGVRKRLPMAKSVAQVRRLCASGLNGGTDILAPQPGSGGAILQRFRLTGGKMETIGTYPATLD